MISNELSIKSLNKDKYLNNDFNLYNKYEFHKYLILRNDLKSIRIEIDNKFIKIYIKRYRNSFFDLNYAFIYDLDNLLYFDLCSNQKLIEKFYETLKSFRIDIISGIYTKYKESYAEIPKNNFLNLRPWETNIINTNISKNINNLRGTLKKNIKKNIGSSNFIFDIYKNKKESIDLFKHIKYYKKSYPIICPFIYENNSFLNESLYSISYLNKKILSLSGILYDSNVSIINTTIKTKLDKELKANSTKLLIWKILEDLNNININYFDFAGYSHIPRTTKEIGISSFKKNWPGRKYYFLYGDAIFISNKIKLFYKLSMIKKLLI